MPLIPALRRQRQVRLCEFQAWSTKQVTGQPRTVTQRNPVSKHKTKSKQTSKQKNNSKKQKQIIKEE
jgi:predicted nuclease of restriction endonuclease-like (RecB) superfamily